MLYNASSPQVLPKRKKAAKSKNQLIILSDNESAYNSNHDFITEKETRTSGDDNESSAPQSTIKVYQDRKVSDCPLEVIVVPPQPRDRRKSVIDINKEISDEELNELSYEDAIEIDDRNFFKLYWGYLQEEEIIMNTFIKSSFLELKSIRIIVFFTGIAIDFCLNALFYTDDLIAAKYKNGGTLDFIIS